MSNIGEDLFDVMAWAEEYMAEKPPIPEPTPADRQGFEPFDYTERS